MTPVGTQWSRVQEDKDRDTSRLKVPGGWLYCVIEKGEMGGILKEFVVYVPQPRKSNDPAQG